MTTGQVCVRPRKHGNTQCGYHCRVAENRRVRERIRSLLDEIMELLWGGGGPAAARRHMEQCYERGDITPDFHHAFTAVVENEIDAFERWNVQRVAREGLAALAHDSQNVHTPEVNHQTIEGLALLTEGSPETENTIVELTEAWQNKHYRAFHTVMNDVWSWYRKPLCRVPGDYLYRRALDGLWTRIKASPHRVELTERLWQECSEACEMCCDGHLARLCNVMVGFDDAFKPPVSAGELLQHRIASIAEMELDIHYKVGEAWKVFEELAIPMAERIPWLEAL
jgi:hypothetical protein